MNTAAKLGTKRNCSKCSMKFYDFGKSSIQCPKCGTEFDPEAQVKLFKVASESKKAPRPKAVLAEDEETTAVSSVESFESIDDLGDDDEGLEDIATDKNPDDE